MVLATPVVVILWCFLLTPFPGTVLTASPKDKKDKKATVTACPNEISWR
jgi:hypothetical protein